MNSGDLRTPGLFMSKFRKERNMNFKDAFELMKKRTQGKAPILGWILVLGCRERNGYDAVQTERH